MNELTFSDLDNEMNGRLMPSDVLSIFQRHTWTPIAGQIWILEDAIIKSACGIGAAVLDRHPEATAALEIDGRRYAAGEHHSHADRQAVGLRAALRDGVYLWLQCRVFERDGRPANRVGSGAYRATGEGRHHGPQRRHFDG